MVAVSQCKDIHLSGADITELEELFHKLDVNKDGKIDVKDLTVAFTTLEVTQFPGHAKVFLKRYDRNNTGDIDFNDFVTYMLDHEKQLRLSFKKLDHNNDGIIDVDEIMIVFSQMGVKIDKHEAMKLLMRIDRDKTLQVSWEEWRDYFRLHPTSDLISMVHYWRHGTVSIPVVVVGVLPAEPDLRIIHPAARDFISIPNAWTWDGAIDYGGVARATYGLAEMIDVGESLLVPDDFTEVELQTGMWWRHLVAGAAAGIISRTCTAPLDRLKVMLQVHGAKHNIHFRNGFSHMIREGGYISLWRGNGINVLKIAPESALKFCVYEQIKRLIAFSDPGRPLGISERFLAGSMAGVFSQSVIYPMEMLKTRLVLRKTGQYSGIVDCAYKIYKCEGLKSFYRGYIPNIIGIIPYAGIDLAVYETLKSIYTDRHPLNQAPGIFVLLSCGTISSSCGQLASYPLALVKTKLQAKSAMNLPKNTMGYQFKTILEKEGPRGLYRGIAPNFLKVAPAVSISYVVYEHVRKLLGIEMT